MLPSFLSDIKRCQDILDQWEEESSQFEALGLKLTKYFENVADTENLILPQEVKFELFSNMLFKL